MVTDCQTCGRSKSDGRAECSTCRARRHRGGLKPRLSVVDRFWSKVDVTADCWTWTGWLTADGYGQFVTTQHTKVRAHRFAYEDRIGLIADGLVLDHLCRNRACVNPAHLEPVTSAENTRRGLLGQLRSTTTTARAGTRAA